MPHRLASWRLASGSGGGAVAVIFLQGDIDATLDAMRVREVAPGELALRVVEKVDTLLVARPSATHAWLFPHAGPAVVAAVVDRLKSVGAPERASSPLDEYPEARDIWEARMLDALARSASPLAVDLLLDQPRRWRTSEHQDEAGSGHDPAVAERSRVLARLLVPPMVAVVGRPNIGKSSLVNALAGRGVSIVADEPGVTRDYVGALVDAHGLCVRLIDTPGQRARDDEPSADETERSAIAMARDQIARADCTLRCIDANDEPVRGAIPPGTLVVRTRADLAADGPNPPPPGSGDIVTSVKTGAGLDRLALAIRETLVPTPILDHPGPWRFWDDGAARPGA